ncbi:ParA partition protein; Borrelia protein family PFam32 (plasmid) [Borreliella afzelii PKo]|uniref:ParA partition protein Borrelia protein family PFam32 n=2 Tax=Borreliella afzelii TaxID=29518 RepID=Q0SLI0_BORAP|nr:hypothetical protein BAPKO_3506 [Borreliella afzelii PKo]AEL70531.1 ParA partition protein; Borrelia protein family PFam32 [Borreliella afzelii PKo]MBB5141632.1 cellulose biosynthesis protein BcsQ [Borreliella afzelii]
MDTKKPIIITMASLKGGVSKSIFSILFSYVIKNLSKKVLLIDLDSQNSLTYYFRKYVFNIEKFNLYNILKGDVYFDQCINKINDHISLIPSHPILAKFNSEKGIDYKDVS